MRVNLNLTGPTAKNRSLFTSNQRTLNFYPELQGDQFILHGFPGLSAFSLGNGPCRGWIEHKGTVYQVQGDSLYSVSSAGVVTLLGSIGGVGKCIFSAIVDSVVIVVEGNVYEWDGSTLTTGTDVDFESPTSCAFINNRIIYNGTGNRWCCSEVGDPLNIDSLNYATAESDATDIVRVFVYDQIVYLFKGRAAEGWRDTGDLSNPPPFERYDTIIPVGLAGIHAVGSNDTGMYFLGDDLNFYVAKGFVHQPISTPAIVNEVNTFTTVSDCEVNTLTFQGHNFVLFTFPNENRTFGYDETIGVQNGWFELSSGEADDERYLASTIGTAFNKILVSDFNNGNIYELDQTVFTEVGDAVIRLRDSAPFHGGLIGAPGARIANQRFELFIETGVGSVTEPVVLLLYSDDGGRTWSNEARGTLGVGVAGSFIKVIQWVGLGSFYNRIFRVKGSDSVLYSIRGAAIDIEIGI